MVLLSMLVVTWVSLLLDGALGLNRPGAFHRVGIPLRRGCVWLERPIPPGAELPAEARGANAVWLGERTLGYWDSTFRLGVRDSFGSSFTRGMGIVSSGTLDLSEDGRSGVYVERLRLGPVAISALPLTFVLLPAAESGLAFGAVTLLIFGGIYLIFGGIYLIFARLSLDRLEKVRFELVEIYPFLG